MTQEEIDEDYWYCWDEADYMENRLFYEYDLAHLEELPTRDNRSSANENK